MQTHLWAKFPGLPFIPLLLERGDPVIPQCSDWRFCPLQSYSEEWMSGPSLEAVKTQSTAQQKHCRLLSTVSSSISSFFTEGSLFFHDIYIFLPRITSIKFILVCFFFKWKNRNLFSLVFMEDLIELSSLPLVDFIRKHHSWPEAQTCM